MITWIEREQQAGEHLCCTLKWIAACSTQRYDKFQTTQHGTPSLKDFPIARSTKLHLSISVQRYISMQVEHRADRLSIRIRTREHYHRSPSPKTDPDKFTPAAMPWTWYAPALVSIIQQTMRLLRWGFTFPGSHVRFPACFQI